MIDTPPARPPDRGFALLIVLWGLVIPALLGTRIVTAGRMEVQLAANLRAAASAEAAADGAVYRTLYNLFGPAEARWPPQGRFTVSVGGASVEIAVENLSGRVNPNIAAPELLRAVLREAGLEGPRADALTASIVEWRARGPRPTGLKVAEYQAAGLDYAPPELPLRSLEELGAVRGMTPELLARLRPHLTLAWENEPDPAFADPVVLAALRRLGVDQLAQRGAARPVQAVAITATASAGGARFTRTAAAIVNAADAKDGWRILAWGTPP